MARTSPSVVATTATPPTSIPPSAPARWTTPVPHRPANNTMAATLRTQTDIATPPLLAPSGGIPTCRVSKAQTGHKDPHNAAARRGSRPSPPVDAACCLVLDWETEAICTYILASILATNRNLSRANGPEKPGIAEATRRTASVRDVLRHRRPHPSMKNRGGDSNTPSAA